MKELLITFPSINENINVEMHINGKVADAEIVDPKSVYDYLISCGTVPDISKMIAAGRAIMRDSGSAKFDINKISYKINRIVLPPGFEDRLNNKLSLSINHFFGKDFIFEGQIEEIILHKMNQSTPEHRCADLFALECKATPILAAMPELVFRRDQHIGIVFNQFVSALQDKIRKMPINNLRFGGTPNDVRSALGNKIKLI